MERIGIRELRQNASVYVRRVERGESFEVTDHGRLVAQLVPPRQSPWEDLVARGLVAEATDPTPLLSEITVPEKFSAFAELMAMREDER
jgi:prevent-host-death family protein